MPRLLVTGSRTWSDGDTIDAALGAAWRERLGADPSAVLVHGGARGVDLMAAARWRSRGLPVEEHRADWKSLGKRAGIVRNEHMVSLGADVCLAFIGLCGSPGCTREDTHASHGAMHCATAANAAGITVVAYYGEGINP